MEKEDEGFDLIIVSIPSSRDRARLHRSLAFDWFEALPYHKIKNPTTDVVGFLMAEDEGFELHGIIP